MSAINRLSFQSEGGLWKGIKENHHGDEKFDKKLNIIGLPKYRDVYLPKSSLFGYHAINWL